MTDVRQFGMSVPKMCLFAQEVRRGLRMPGRGDACAAKVYRAAIALFLRGGLTVDVAVFTARSHLSVAMTSEHSNAPPPSSILREY
jgi:hypothetical protein